MSKATGPRNKQRGYEHETELVKRAKELGYGARRAWGSNGASIGLPPGVDVEITPPDGGGSASVPAFGMTQWVQAKRTKELPKWCEGLLKYLRPGGGCNAVVFRKDRDENFVLLRFEDYLLLLETP